MNTIHPTEQPVQEPFFRFSDIIHLHEAYVVAAVLWGLAGAVAAVWGGGK